MVSLMHSLFLWVQCVYCAGVEWACILQSNNDIVRNKNNQSPLLNVHQQVELFVRLGGTFSLIFQGIEGNKSFQKSIYLLHW